MLLFEIGYELVFYLVMNVRFHYLLEKWNFCVYHWYGNFSLFLTKILKEFYTGTIVIEMNLYWKVFMQGFCFLKIFIITILWHMEICSLSDLKMTPACLNIVLRGLDTEHRLLTAVLLALDASWLTSSSLDIRGYRLTLDNREICSHACYSWV